MSVLWILLLLLLSGCVYELPSELKIIKNSKGELMLRNISVEENVSNGALSFEEEVLENEIFESINAVREERGIPPLRWDEEAASVARGYARKMMAEKFFSHYTPEGEDVGDRVDAAGIDYARVGENLAFIEGLENISERAVEGWLKSPRHREVMLDPTFSDLGVGAACDDEVCYIVSIYLEKKFTLTLNLSKGAAYVKVPLNSEAEVSVLADRVARFMVLDEENLEKFKNGEEYVKFGEWRGNGFRTVLTPADYIVVFADGSINLTVEIE